MGPSERVACEGDKARQAAGHRRLRDRWIGLRGELAQGKRGIPEPELGGRVERGREVVERAHLQECARGVELRARRAALADEVRVIRVGEPVGVRAQAGDESPLFEHEHGVRRPRDREVPLDRLPALGIRSRMRVAIDHPHPNAGRRGDAPDERRARMERRADLEVRRPRATERPGAEERASQVRGTTARPGDHPSRGPVDRKTVASQDAGFGQHVDRVERSVDEELRSGTTIERVPPVRADLRVDAQ
jgi:hypothetical protein